MFYWSQADTHVVLTDREELTLVRELADDAQDNIGYHISHDTRRKMEQRIFRYFEEFLRNDPEGFNRKFVFRSSYDDEAQMLFPVLLDAYGRITQRATFGVCSELPPSCRHLHCDHRVCPSQDRWFCVCAHSARLDTVQH